MTQLTKSILEVAVVQARLRGDIDDTDIFKEKIQNVIVNFISSETDPNKKRELLEKLDFTRNAS